MSGGAFEVGSVVTRLGFEVEDREATRYERRVEKMRRESRDDVVTKAKVDTDTRGVERYQQRLRALNDDHDHVVRGSGRLRGALGTLFIGGAVTAGVGVLAQGVGKLVGAFGESEKVAKQTVAVLKSTGHEAGLTSKQIGDLAGSISAKTGADDEMIQSGENVLLTFTNVRNEVGRGNDVFNQATKLALDMSTALGQDLQSSNIQLGKALNDPIKGITALSRVGVSFTAQQKDQITTLVKSGHTLDAQKIILKELRKEFGGSAEATATNSKKMGVALGNVAEAIGGKLNPYVQRAAGYIVKLIGEFDKGTGTGGELRDRLEELGHRAQDVGDFMLGLGRQVVRVVNYFREHKGATDALVSSLGAGAAAFAAWKIVGVVTGLVRTARTAWLLFNLAIRANPIGLVVTALSALAIGLVIAYKRSETFRRIVDGAWGAVKKSAGDAISFILRGIDKWLGGYSSIASAAGKLPGPLGAPFRAAAKVIDRAREHVRHLANEIDGLGEKHKTVNIDVKVKFNGQTFTLGPKDRLTPRPQGDGIGIGAAIDEHLGTLAQQAAASGALMPALPSGAGAGSLMGAQAALGPFAAIGSGFGLGVSSGRRPGSITSSGNVSYHSSGEAIDEAGSPAGMLAYFLYLRSNFGSRLAELIYTPGGVGIKNGRPYRYTGQVARDHYDHVHVAFDTGRPGVGDGHGRSARVAFTGDGPGRRRKAKPKKPPAPVLTRAENRGITRSLSRGERGIGTYEDRIQRAEREYSTMDRRFGLSDEVLLIENEDGSTTVDQAAVDARAGELDSLTTKRGRIRSMIQDYRDRVRSLIAALKAAVARLRRALRAAKGKARQKERGGYRAAIDEHQSRIKELQGVAADLGLDLRDQDIDYDELVNEWRAVRDTTGAPAPSADTSAPDAGAPDSPAPPDNPPDTPEPAAAAPTTEDIARAAAEQIASFASSQQDLFSQFGSNFVTSGAAMFPTGVLPGAALRGFGAFGGDGGAAGAGGVHFEQHITMTEPPPDPHIWAQQQRVEIETALG